MTQILFDSSTGLRTLAILSGLMLGSCQTNAGDILTTGAIDAANQTSPATTVGYSDSQVVAVAAQDGAERPATEPPASFKRKPVPLAAAYSDIAEPPPEVVALQQQAMAGTAAPQDLGVTQPTEVNTGKNSLFSASRPQTPSPVAVSGEAQATQPQAVASAQQPVTSLVPGNMPTLGVNAMSKSLFSPSVEQQQMLSVPEQPAAPAAAVPLIEPDTGPPKLHKLSDPRPKRKMLALREPTTTVTAVQPPGTTVPARVQLTPAQLEAMGAVPETSADAAVAAAAEPDKTATIPSKKKWLPSFSDLLKGGTKAKAPTP